MAVEIRNSLEYSCFKATARPHIDLRKRRCISLDWPSATTQLAVNIERCQKSIKTEVYSQPTKLEIIHDHQIWIPITIAIASE
ncbi:hypothetical protein PTI98_012626 [Pleurotus ostreatus]|nr:hypothetical protein PTI98_012626 [Pleurotus ostreatus]KAJ8689759.1 hypothetical protein PTI98_012626 [Pleurotus ostreatus]